MIQTEEQIEQPGKNAIEHACEMRVEIPGEDGEDSTFKKCLILAIAQCSECTAWVCGNVELEHSIICVRCDGTFCPEHWQAHKMSKDCEQAA